MNAVYYVSGILSVSMLGFENKGEGRGIFIEKRAFHINFDNIRIYHECEGGIEKSILRITVWHH